MNTKQDEFFQALDGDLTPELAAQLLEMGEGDTDSIETEDDGVPGAAADEGGEGDATSQADTNTQAEDEPDPANAVLLAKDGKHTISYDKLVEAREAAKAERARAEEAERKLAQYQAEAEQRRQSGEGPTAADVNAAAAQAAIDEGYDPDIFGDFSEESLAKGIQTLIDLKVESKVEALVNQKLAPLQQKEAQAEANAHLEAIYTAHPDADSIVESKELDDWISSQPSFAQAAYRNVLTDGTTQEVISLFDQFKAATGSAPAAGVANDDVTAAANKAIAKAKAAVPVSLSDLPGGRPGGTTREEAMAQMTGTDLLEALADMPPEKIEEFLNRRI